MTKKITILGQGYVGLPLSLSFAMHGCIVTGIDNNKIIVEQLAQGITSQTEECGGRNITEILKDQLLSGRYTPKTESAESIQTADAVIITVGIPIDNGNPIYSPFHSACETVGQNLRKGTVVMIRSTVIPGTTESYCIPLFEQLSKLQCGKDFYVSYVPERIAEGKAFEEFSTMPTVIAAADDESCKKSADILKINCKADLIFSNSIIAAETSKVLENLQRDVNIAMVQEFARFTEANDIDIFEVIHLANTHKRVNLLTPGPGVGGYCIPNAFHYLNVKAQESGLSLPLLRMAREHNDSLPKWFAEKTIELLIRANKPIHGAIIAIAGLAMKDFSPDDRLSPSINICEELQKGGAVIRAYDPNVAANYSFKVNTFTEAVNGADALLILNPLQKSFDPMPFITSMASSPVIIDTRNIVRKNELPQDAIYWKI